MEQRTAPVKSPGAQRQISNIIKANPIKSNITKATKHLTKDYINTPFAFHAPYSIKMSAGPFREPEKAGKDDTLSDSRCIVGKTARGKPLS